MKIIKHVQIQPVWHSFLHKFLEGVSTLRSKFPIQIGPLCPGSSTCHAHDHILVHSIVIQLPEHTVLFTIADCPFLGKQTKCYF